MIPYRNSAPSGLRSATRVATRNAGMLSNERRVWASTCGWGVLGSIRRLPRAAHNYNALKASETATKVNS
jgi:hypothetical protein